MVHKLLRLLRLLRVLKVLKVLVLLEIHQFLQHENLTMHSSSPCPTSHINATEPLHTRFISMFLQPYHRYRTLQCTVHLFVSPATPSLQNLTMHSSSPCFSNHNIATEPMPPVQKPLPSKKEAVASVSIFSIYPIFPALTKESNDRFHFLDWSGCYGQ